MKQFRRYQFPDGFLETHNGTLYVVSKFKLDIKEDLKKEYGYFFKVLEAWESWNGFYWFRLTKSDENGICFGFVQLHDAEFGPIDTKSFNDPSVKFKVWKLKKSNLFYSGVRELPDDWNEPLKSENGVDNG